MLLGKMRSASPICGPAEYPIYLQLPIISNQGMIVVELVVYVAFAFPQEKT